MVRLPADMSQILTAKPPPMGIPLVRIPVRMVVVSEGPFKFYIPLLAK